MEPLEPSANVELPKTDKRPVIPQPLPVNLVAIEDVHLPAAAGKEVELDEFYIGLWGFERDAQSTQLAYHAENFRLCFDILEPPIARDELRPIGIEVPSLRAAEHKLIDAEIEYERQKGLTAGSDLLLARDPAGNWVQVGETRLL